MKYILILSIFFLASCGNTTAPVKQQEVQQAAATPAQPSTPVNPNIKINFKDLTIGQFEQLNALLAKTPYKDSAVIKPETVMNTNQVDAVLKNLSTLPYRDVVQMIDLLYNSGTRQVKEQTAVK